VSQRIAKVPFSNSFANSGLYLIFKCFVLASGLIRGEWSGFTRQSTSAGIKIDLVSSIFQTYGYVVGGIGITAAFATAIARTPSLYYRIASVNPIAMMLGTVAGVIGTCRAATSWWHVLHQPLAHQWSPASGKCAGQKGGVVAPFLATGVWQHPV
jgi:hypothetical protein